MTGPGLRPLLVATGLVFGALLLAGPHGCSGSCLFDAKPCPYDAEAARAHLAAMGSEAIGRYLWVTQPLDTVFPALVCLCLRAAFSALAPLGSVGFFGRLALIEAGVDYLENTMIRVMLKDPVGFPDAVAPLASGLTIAKWLMLAALFGAVLALWRARRV